VVAVLLAGGGAGCRKKTRRHTPETETETTEPATPERAPDGASNFVVAFLYAGPKEDYGFNEAHAAGAAAVGKLLGVKVVETDNVPETSGAAVAMEKALVVDGAKVVFATGFGHFDPALLTEAGKHPDVQFLHDGGFYQEGKHPANAGTYAGNLDEAYYVAGVVAGLTSKSSRLGFVAGWATPASLRNVNAFTLGARSVNPRAVPSVVFTNNWSDAAAEEKAANALADARADVLASFVRSPKVVLQTAETRGIYSIGAHVDGSALAPKGHLTSVVSSWERVYTELVTAVRDGKPFPHVIRGGIGDGYVNISPFGPAVAEDTKKKALEVRGRLAQGTLTIFQGPLKDNHGAQIMAAGQALLPKDVTLEQMGYLVEGVSGSLPD